MRVDTFLAVDCDDCWENVWSSSSSQLLFTGVSKYALDLLRLLLLGGKSQRERERERERERALITLRHLSLSSSQDISQDSDELHVHVNEDGASTPDDCSTHNEMEKVSCRLKWLRR